jgi:hypothetical protein
LRSSYPQLSLVVERARRVERVIRDRRAVRRIERMLVGKPAVRRDVLHPPRLQVDDDDVALVHHGRLDSRIDRQRDLAAVRGDVVMLRRRIPWLQRDAGAQQQVLAAAGGDVAREQMRLAAIRQPVVPEAIFASLRQVCRDLGFLLLRDAPGLRGFGAQLRPHPRDEGDPLAVGKPFDCRSARCDVREARRFAAVGCYEIDLRLGVVLALGGERNPRSVGRPARIAVLVTGGETARLPRRSAVAVAGREQPQLRAAEIAVERERRHRRARKAPVRRERRRADPLQCPQRIDVERRFAAGG